MSTTNVSIVSGTISSLDLDPVTLRHMVSACLWRPGALSTSAERWLGHVNGCVPAVGPVRDHNASHLIFLVLGIKPQTAYILAGPKVSLLREACKKIPHTGDTNSLDRCG